MEDVAHVSVHDRPRRAAHLRGRAQKPAPRRDSSAPAAGGDRNLARPEAVDQADLELVVVLFRSGPREDLGVKHRPRTPNQRKAFVQRAYERRQCLAVAAQTVQNIRNQGAKEPLAKFRDRGIGSLGGTPGRNSFGHGFLPSPQRPVSKPPGVSAVNLPLALDLLRPPSTSRQQSRRSRSVLNLEGVRRSPQYAERGGRRRARNRLAAPRKRGAPSQASLPFHAGKSLHGRRPASQGGVRAPNCTGNAVNRRQTTCLATSRRRGC